MGFVTNIVPLNFSLCIFATWCYHTCYSTWWYHAYYMIKSTSKDFLHVSFWRLLYTTVQNFLTTSCFTHVLLLIPTLLLKSSILTALHTELSSPIFFLCIMFRRIEEIGTPSLSPHPILHHPPPLWIFIQVMSACSDQAPSASSTGCTLPPSNFLSLWPPPTLHLSTATNLSIHL